MEKLRLILTFQDEAESKKRWVRPPLRLKLRLIVTSDEQVRSNSVGMSDYVESDLRQNEDDL